MMHRYKTPPPLRNACCLQWASLPKALLTPLLCLLLGAAQAQQSPYKGGPGDGYASIRLEEPIVGLENPRGKTQAWQVAPTLAEAGQKLRLRGPAAEQLTLWNARGQQQARTEKPGPHWQLPADLPPGVYFLRLRKGVKAFTQKIILR